MVELKNCSGHQLLQQKGWLAIKSVRNSCPSIFNLPIYLKISNHIYTRYKFINPLTFLFFFSNKNYVIQWKQILKWNNGKLAELLTITNPYIASNWSFYGVLLHIPQISKQCRYRSDWLLTLCMPGNFNSFLVICWLLFQQILSGTLSKCQTILDPDQDRQNVSPDLGQNCLQRLAADDKYCC